MEGALSGSSLDLVLPATGVKVQWLQGEVHYVLKVLLLVFADPFFLL